LFNHFSSPTGGKGKEEEGRKKGKAIGERILFEQGKKRKGKRAGKMPFPQARGGEGREGINSRGGGKKGSLPLKGGGEGRGGGKERGHA